MGDGILDVSHVLDEGYILEEHGLEDTETGDTGVLEYSQVVYLPSC